MENIIAKCGLVCNDCPAYQATTRNNDNLRKETAKNWSKMFNVQIPWETINCLGCQQDNKEKLIGHCLVCGIRACAKEKGLQTCAECIDFGCEKLKQIWDHDQAAKQRLTELRA